MKNILMGFFILASLTIFSRNANAELGCERENIVSQYRVFRLYSWSNPNSYNNFAWGSSTAYNGYTLIGIYNKSEDIPERFINSGEFVIKESKVKGHEYYRCDETAEVKVKENIKSLSQLTAARKALDNEILNDSRNSFKQNESRSQASESSGIPGIQR